LKKEMKKWKERKRSIIQNYQIGEHLSLFIWSGDEGLGPKLRRTWDVRISQDWVSLGEEIVKEQEKSWRLTVSWPFSISYPVYHIPVQRGQAAQAGVW